MDIHHTPRRVHSWSVTFSLSVWIFQANNLSAFCAFQSVLHFKFLTLKKSHDTKGRVWIFLQSPYTTLPCRKCQQFQHTSHCPTGVIHSRVSLVTRTEKHLIYKAHFRTLLLPISCSLEMINWYNLIFSNQSRSLKNDSSSPAAFQPCGLDCFFRPDTLIYFSRLFLPNIKAPVPTASVVFISYFADTFKRGISQWEEWWMKYRT